MIFAEVVANDWGWLLNQGLAVLVLVAVGFYAISAIAWLGNNFLLPLKDAAVAYLEVAADTMARISATLDRQQTEIKNISQRLEVLDTLAERYVAVCERSEGATARPRTNAGSA